MMERSRDRTRLIAVAMGCVAGAVGISAEVASAQSTTTWTGLGSSNNWSDANNWNPTGTPPYGILAFAGSTRPSNTNDNITNMFRIDFRSTSDFTLGGNTINFFDFSSVQSRIENQNSGHARINFTVNFANTNPANPFAEINPVSGPLTFGSTVNMTGSQVNEIRIFGSSGHAVTFNAAVTGSGRAFVVRNASEVVFNAANSYSGDTSIEAGTVSYGQGGQTSSPFHRVGLTSGATSATLRIVDADGGTTLNNGIVIRSGTGARRLHATNTSGTNTFAGNIFMDGNASTSILAGGTLSFSGTTIDLKNQTLTIGGAGNTLVTQGLKNPTVGEVGHLIKNDAGTLFMQGTSTMKGTTTVNAGKLIYDGTLSSGAGAVTVNAATLGGSGTLSAAVSISSSGTLSGGDVGTFGMLAIGGNATLTTGSTFVADVDGSGGLPGTAGLHFDQVAIIGTGRTLNLGNSTLSITIGPNTVANQPYRIVEATGNTVAGVFAGIVDNVIYSLMPGVSYKVNYFSDHTDLTFTEVPEPSALGLLLVGAWTLHRRRR